MINEKTNYSSGYDGARYGTIRGKLRSTRSVGSTQRAATQRFTAQFRYAERAADKHRSAECAAEFAIPVSGFVLVFHASHSGHRFHWNRGKGRGQVCFEDQ